MLINLFVCIFKEIYQCYHQIFGIDRVRPYLVYIPTYPSGMWSFSFCSKGEIHPISDLDTKRWKLLDKVENLSYYNPDIHMASFALPNFVKQMLDHEIVVES